MVERFDKIRLAPRRWKLLRSIKLEIHVYIMYSVPSNTRFLEPHTPKFAEGTMKTETLRINSLCYIPAPGGTWSKQVAVTEHHSTKSRLPVSWKNRSRDRFETFVLRAQTRAGFPRVRKTIVRGPVCIEVHRRKWNSRGFETAGVAFRDRLADCRPPDVATRPLPMTHATLVCLSA